MEREKHRRSPSLEEICLHMARRAMLDTARNDAVARCDLIAHLKRRKKWRNGRDTEASESEFHEEDGLERRLFVHLKKEEREGKHGRITVAKRVKSLTSV
jgi:hypothetical protein